MAWRPSVGCDFCELFSRKREPCDMLFQPLPLTTHSGQQKASRTEQHRLRLESIDNGIFGSGNLVLHPFYGILWALKL